MNIGIFQETKPVTGSNVLVGAIYKKTAPSTLISSHLWTGPYTGQTQTFTFAGVLPVVYIYICWESPDGSPSGTARNQFEIQPNSNTYNTRDNLTLISDESAFFSSGGTTYGPDSSLLSWNWYLERKAQGTQNDGTVGSPEYIKTKAGVDTTIDDTTANGWRLAVAGDVVGVNEQFIVHFYPQLAASSVSIISNTISNTQRLTMDTLLDNSAPGQSFLLQGNGVGYFKVTLPDINTVPTNEPIYFISAGGNHVNVGIFSFSGQRVNFFKNSPDLTIYTDHIYLGQCETLAVYKMLGGDIATPMWVVMNGGEGYLRVGEMITGYSNKHLNSLFLDGTQGLSRATFARCWEWVQTLDSACVVTAAAWNNTTTKDGISYNINHGKFNSGDGNTTFGLPKIYELGFLRALNGASGAGTFNGFPGDLQALMLFIHKHAETVGLLPNEPNGQAAPPTNPIGGAIDMGLYKNPGGVNVDMTSTPMNNAAAGAIGNILAQIGNENRPSNFGVYMSIRI